MKPYMLVVVLIVAAGFGGSVVFAVEYPYRQQDQLRIEALSCEARSQDAAKATAALTFKLSEAERARDSCEDLRKEVPVVCDKLAEDNAWLVDHCGWPSEKFPTPKEVETHRTRKVSP